MFLLLLLNPMLMCQKLRLSQSVCYMRKESSKTKEAVVVVRPCLCLDRRRDHGVFIVESLDISGEIVIS